MSFHCLGHPVRKDLDFLIGVGGIIGLEMQPEIMQPAHTAVHHGLHPDSRRLSGVEDHRTDGRDRGSTSLGYLQVRFLGKPQRLVTGIGDADGIVDGDAQFYRPMVDPIGFNLKTRAADYTATRFRRCAAGPNYPATSQDQPQAGERQPET